MAKKAASAAVKKRGTYHHGNLKEALLTAAERRIGESQDFDFRLRDLAEDCGVQLAACYRHFAAKSDVLVELARRGFVALEQALSKVTAGDDPRRALAELGACYVRFGVESPVAYLAMFHPALAQRGASPDLDQAALRALLQLRAAVMRALGTGADARTIDRAVFQAWAGVHGYTSLLVSQGRDGSTPLVSSAANKKAIAAYTEMLAHGVLSGGA